MTLAVGWNLDDPPVPDDAVRARIVFVRHGQSEWNARALIQGHEGGGRTALGRKQAHAVAGYLCHALPTPYVVVTSDLRRAVETAQCYVARSGFGQLRLESRLREVDNGEWSGRPAAEVASREAGYITRIRHGEDLRRGGGESLADAQHRVVEFTAELAAELARCPNPVDRWAVAFGHGGTIRLSALAALGLPGGSAQLIGHAANSAISEIEYWVRADGSVAATRLLEYNSAQHLTLGPDGTTTLHVRSGPAN